MGGAAKGHIVYNRRASVITRGGGREAGFKGDSLEIIIERFDWRLLRSHHLNRSDSAEQADCLISARK